jgi:heat shock protein HslJ
MHSRSKLILAAIGVALAGCSMISGGAAKSSTPSTQPASPGSSEPSATGSPPDHASALPTRTPGMTRAPSGSLDGRTFASVSVTQDGKNKPLVSGTRIQLMFAVANMTASAGCNTSSGDYHIDGGKLIVGSMATSAMGCPQNLGEQDNWLWALLASHPEVQLHGNSLNLTSGNTTVSLLDVQFAQPDQPLTDITWNLTTIAKGDVAESMPAGVVATLLFHENGQVQVDFGCNSGGGQYAVDGDVLHFSRIVSTTMACGGAKDEVNSAVSKLLAADSVTYAIDGRTLTLHAGSDELEYAAAVDVSYDLSNN